MYVSSVHLGKDERSGARDALTEGLTALTAGGKVDSQREKQMKLFAKIGAVSLIGGVVVLLSAPVDASKATEAHEDYTAMKHVQAQARAENDIIKLNCVNDKLVQAKPLLNIIDAGDDKEAGQVHELRIAAEGCAGRKQISSIGGTNSFTGPPGAGEPDPGWSGWGTIFEPGANASPSTPIP